ncbi:hypothetical protein QLQ12_41105 [Actinoplanes sp. NEAU-A12]|uniref:Uncharacterized protein n=1 Tax=Actinoplanes sandaracinus TaxID=3045177 RepID=A0ABT6WZ39_9ACTN|nr:hypothetical protein [Actinoplanes sandaracinus]MDI6105003.1 hypothetical protein [Actinoplanes sandaracinus]
MGPREPESEAGFGSPDPRREGDAVVTPEPPVSRPLRGRPLGQRGRFQSRRARLVLALTGGFLALLCLGGVGAFFVLYEEATEIKRTAPDAVVDSFLAAFLVSRNDQEAALYRCTSEEDLTPIVQFREDVVRREKEFSVGISVTWSSLQVSIDGSSGTVTTDLTRTISGQAGRDSSTWKFSIVDQDGWRVCGAKQTS